jgi:hypothetical protein
MPDTAAFLTREQLLAYAVEHGHRVSGKQLDRWRKRGLIPSPVLKGRGRGPGMEARYPLSAGPQLIAVAGALRETRDLDAVRWRLWWQGFAIAERYIRPQLIESLVHIRERRAEVESIRDDDEAFERFNQKTRRRLGTGGLARIRRRLGKDRFVTFMMLLNEIASGTYDSPNSDNARDNVKRLNEGLELVAMKMDNDTLLVLSRAFDPDALQAVIDTLETGELVAARDELKPLPPLLVEVGAQHPTEDFGGVSGAAVAVLADAVRNDVQPGLFLIWVRARRHPAFRTAYALFAAMRQKLAGPASK